LEFECRLNDERVKQVNEFVYVGRVFEKSGSMDGEINRRVCVNRKVVGTMAMLARSRCLSHKARLASYNAVLLPILLLGLESWVFLEKHRSKLNAVGMNFLHAMCGKNRFDKVRNDWVMNKCGVTEKWKNILKGGLCPDFLAFPKREMASNYV
jgi:hypothetical protein